MELIKNCDRCGASFRGTRCECGTEWASETAQLAYEAFKSTIEDAAGEAIEHAVAREKEEKVANLRRMLWKELHTEEKFYRGENISEYANKILAISPKATDAQFYSIAGEKRWKDVKRFLKNLTTSFDAKKHLRYVEDFVRFLTNPWAGREIELALMGLIVRAYEGTDKKGELCEKIRVAKAEKTDYTEERDAFIAYSSADLDKVFQLVDALEDRGLKCFVSARDSTQGLDANLYYEQDLQTAIDHCKVFVFVSTRNSRDKDICPGAKKELEYIRLKDLTERAPAELRASCEADYGSLDIVYKKPRVEWVVDKYGTKKTGYEKKIAHEYFEGFTRATSLEDAVSKVEQAVNASKPIVKAEGLKRRKENSAPAVIEQPISVEEGAGVAPAVIEQPISVEEETAVAPAVIEQPNSVKEGTAVAKAKAITPFLTVEDIMPFLTVVYWVSFGISMLAGLFLAVYGLIENGNFEPKNTPYKVWTAVTIVYFIFFSICLIISLVSNCEIVYFDWGVAYWWIISLCVSGGVMALCSIGTLYSATIGSGIAWRIITLIAVIIMLLVWIKLLDENYGCGIWSWSANITLAFWVLLFAIFTPIQAKNGYDGVFIKGEKWSYTVTGQGVELYLRKADRTFTVDAHSEINVPSEVKGKTVTKVATLDKIKRTDKVTSIIFPDTVTDISGFSFKDFYNLKTVDFGGVTSIDEMDFDATKVTEVVIPKTVEIIEEKAFYNCKNLQKVTFEEGSVLDKIEDYAFAGCTALKSLEIPASVTEIGVTSVSSVFEGCGVTALSVAEGNVIYRSIDGCLIRGKNVVFGVDGCTIPTDARVNGIEAYAFNGKKMISLNIPANITSIAPEAFYGVYGLETLTVSSENPNYYAVGNCIINKKNKVLLVGCKNSEIPNDGSVVEIGQYAFAKRLDMISLVIPLDIQKVYATSFEGCDKLAVYCLAAEKPESWEDFWTGNVKKILWGYDIFA